MAPDRYKVVRVYQKSNKKTVLAKGVTKAQAERKVNSFKTKNSSMVVFYKM